MKARKQTKTSIVKNLMSQGKGAQDIAKETGIKLPYVYTLMSNVRKGKKKLTPVNKYKNIDGAQVLFSKDVEKLQAEVIKLNEWCIEWRDKCIALEDMNTKLKNDNEYKTKYFDAVAVVRYLEDKLAYILTNSK